MDGNGSRWPSLKDVFVIVNETTREPGEDPVDKVFRLGTVVGLANHTILIRRDGTELAIDNSAAPVHNAEGEMRGVVLVFRDVTERREAEWNLQLLSASGRVLADVRDAASIIHRIDVLITKHFADLAIFESALAFWGARAASRTSPCTGSTTRCPGASTFCSCTGRSLA